MRLDPREARAILRQCDFAALATQSARLPGFPFASHAPFALDAWCRPVLLLSRLAEHTRNLAADPRASLMATAPGPDPQEQARLTVLGEIAPIEAEPPLVARYLRYHPEASTWIGFGDFDFYRLSPLRVRLIGGFARAGWIEPEDWAARPFDLAAEAGLIDALDGARPRGWAVLGVDWEGLDLRHESGRRRRIEWQGVAADPAALAARAREALAAADR